MQECFCTPVPAKRISTNAKLEIRVSALKAKYISIDAVFEDGRVLSVGKFDIEDNLKLNKVYPSIHGICGKFTVKVSFFSAEGNLIDTKTFNYEIVKSEVMSTYLIDGCWISIRHWSETESARFRAGLEKMNDEDWKNHIRSMNKIGITTVLIQNLFDSKHYVNQHSMTADTYDGEAFIDSEVCAKRRPNMLEKDPFEAILEAADECDMAVFCGVGMYAWFDFSPESLIWHKRITKELFEKYGHHKSFYGFYISEEIMGALYYGYDPVPDEKYKDIQNFFKDYSEFVSILAPTKPVALAPNNIDMHLYKDEWYGILNNLDILIPFAFARSENNIPQIYEMCRECDVHFWVDMEMFKFPFDNGALVPKTFDELLKEIHDYDMLEQIFGYQYTGLMNEPGYGKELGGDATEELFVRYKEYTEKIARG